MDAFISHIDQMFDDCPLETYTERLLSYATGREGVLSWYRMILISRLRGHSDNPVFKAAPVTRKSTHKSTSAYKNAKDCYRLISFLNGDMTSPIEEIFATRAYKPSKPEPQDQEHDQSTVNRVESTAMKQLIQSLRLEIAEVKSSCHENIKDMQTKISVLEKENKTLKESLSSIDNEFQNKATLHDSKLRQISASIKDFEHMNPFDVNTKLESLETNQRRIDSTVNRLKVSNAKQGILKNSSNGASPDLVNKPKSSAEINSVPSRHSDPIIRYNKNDESSKVTSNSMKTSLAASSTSRNLTGDDERNDKQPFTPAFRINSLPWDEVVPSRLRQQGPTKGLTNEGAGCKTSDNLNSVTATEIQSKTTPYVTYTYTESVQPTKQTITNERSNCDLTTQRNESNRLRSVPEMVPAAHQYAPLNTFNIPHNFNNVPPFVAGMYAYPYHTPPNIN